MAAVFRPRRDDAPPPRRRSRATPSGDRRTLPAELTQAQRGVRLQKAMADAGVAARRECEELILQGRVTVNGQVVAAMPAWVDPAKDRIEIDGQPMRRQRPSHVPGEKVYVLLNKPRGVITTTDDPDQRKIVTDMVQLPPGLERRLFPVGRLDAETTGLILLTNDGELANRLTHPRYGVPKQYAVSIRGRLSQEDIVSLKEGIHLAHLSHDDDDSPTVKRATMANVELIGYGTDRNSNERTRLLVTLREGQNREIRRMIAHLGHKVRRLERVAIGPLTSKGLGVGQWRFLTGKELAQLQKLASRTVDNAPPPAIRPDRDRPVRAASQRPNQRPAPRDGRPAPRGARPPFNKPAGPGGQASRDTTGRPPRPARPAAPRPAAGVREDRSGPRPPRPTRDGQAPRPTRNATPDRPTRQPAPGGKPARPTQRSGQPSRPSQAGGGASGQGTSRPPRPASRDGQPRPRTDRPRPAAGGPPRSGGGQGRSSSGQGQANPPRPPRSGGPRNQGGGPGKPSGPRKPNGPRKPGGPGKPGGPRKPGGPGKPGGRGGRPR